ncbi:acyltransferase [Brevibacillus ginsengisoli]|uniref:acyltransferase n=1 Tax=Brevibacillus ginsengisoli TaxID=363854 RepID=UPI003CE93A09
MENRLREFDLVRAFAALSVIAIHVTAGYVATNQFGYVWNQLMRYAVPLFIMLSGFLLFYVDQGRAPVTYGHFIRVRFKKVIIPYVLWTLIYFLYNSRHHLSGWIQNEPVKPLIIYLKHLITGTGHVHLYFLLITVQLYLVYPLLKRWIERHAGSLVAVSFLITLFSQTMIYLHQLHVLVLPSLAIPYVSLFPIWLFYFTFGMLAAQKKANWEEKLQGKLLPLTVMWLVSFGLLLLDSKITKTHASSIKPTVMLYCFSSYFLFYVAALKMKQTTSRVGKAMDWLATNSFMIFLLHPLLLSLMLATTQKLGLSAMWQGSFGMIAMYLVTTIITVVATYILRYVPLIDLLGGVPLKKHQKRVNKQMPLAG